MATKLEDVREADIVQSDVAPADPGVTVRERVRPPADASTSGARGAVGDPVERGERDR